MANSKLPMQLGANLPSLDRERDVEEAIEQEDEIEHFEEQLKEDSGNKELIAQILEMKKELQEMEDA